MSNDFRDASERHFADANLLRHEGRNANADHLYGLSAECSLKAIMEALGMKIKNGIPDDKGHKVHMPELWAAFQSFAQGRLAARYQEPLDHDNPFADWIVDQRYWALNSITVTALANHEAAADCCRMSLETLVLDGVTP